MTKTWQSKRGQQSPFMLCVLIFWYVLTATYSSAQTDYFVTSKDATKIHVREFGTGKPIIFLAGGPGLHAEFLKPVWENLANQFRCIIIDQRGTGKSSVAKIDSITISLANYVNDIEALRRHLNEPKVILIGHSWGGLLAMEYASRHPHETEKLILVASGGPTNFADYYGDNIFSRLMPEDIEEEKKLRDANELSLKAIWPGFFYDRTRALMTKQRMTKEMFGQDGIDPLLMKEYSVSGNERLTLLKGYKGIVHVIQGRQDPVAQAFYEIKNSMSQSQIHFIEKCGHFPWLETEEQSTQFFDLMRQCLK